MTRGCRLHYCGGLRRLRTASFFNSSDPIRRVKTASWRSGRTPCGAPPVDDKGRPGGPILRRTTGAETRCGQVVIVGASCVDSTRICSPTSEKARRHRQHLGRHRRTCASDRLNHMGLVPALAGARPATSRGSAASTSPPASITTPHKRDTSRVRVQFGHRLQRPRRAPTRTIPAWRGLKTEIKRRHPPGSRSPVGEALPTQQRIIVCSAATTATRRVTIDYRPSRRTEDDEHMSDPSRAAQASVVELVNYRGAAREQTARHPEQGTCGGLRPSARRSPFNHMHDVPNVSSSTVLFASSRIRTLRESCRCRGVPDYLADQMKVWSAVMIRTNPAYSRLSALRAVLPAQARPPRRSGWILTLWPSPPMHPHLAAAAVAGSGVDVTPNCVTPAQLEWFHVAE